jgi:hypothetical protein
MSPAAPTTSPAESRCARSRICRPAEACLAVHAAHLPASRLAPATRQRTQDRGHNRGHIREGTQERGHKRGHTREGAQDRGRTRQRTQERGHKRGRTRQRTQERGRLADTARRGHAAVAACARACLGAHARCGARCRGWGGVCARSDAVVLPTRGEGWGLPLVEVRPALPPALPHRPSRNASQRSPRRTAAAVARLPRCGYEASCGQRTRMRPRSRRPHPQASCDEASCDEASQYEASCGQPRVSICGGGV